MFFFRLLQNTKVFELKVNITDTELVVVEDCTAQDTRAIILQVSLNNCSMGNRPLRLR